MKLEPGKRYELANGDVIVLCRSVQEINDPWPFMTEYYKKAGGKKVFFDKEGKSCEGHINDINEGHHIVRECMDILKETKRFELIQGKVGKLDVKLDQHGDIAITCEKITSLDDVNVAIDVLAQVKKYLEH